jgi:hypothetical protein
MRQAQPLFDFEFDQRMPRFGAERWGYGPPKGTASVAIACLLMAAGAVGLLAARDYLMTRRPEVAMSRNEDRGRAPPVARAPDPAQVDRAYAQVRTVFAQEGLPGLAREGAACFATLERNPDYARLDYCLAFDAFAGGVSRIVGPGPSEAATYFNEATVRHIQATDAVGASRTEANARLRVVSRLATSVARAQARVAPLVVLPPPPPEPEVIEEVEVAPPPVEEETPYRVIGPQAEPAPLSDGTEITPEPISPQPPPPATGVGSPPAPPPEPAPAPARP